MNRIKTTLLAAISIALAFTLSCSILDDSSNGSAGVSSSSSKTPSSSSKQDGVMRVSNVQEFLDALGSDRIIELQPGKKYNLSDEAPEIDYDDHFINPNVFWRFAGDGNELVLDEIENLTIRGVVKNGKNSEIVVEPRYAFVLNFTNSKNIVIENITAGHSDGAECSGGVFSFANSSDIKIIGTKMYGSGTEGLNLHYVSDVEVKDSEIYECTVSIATVYGSKNISFENSIFRDNDGYNLVNVLNNTENLSFKNCKFINNNGANMFNIEDSNISVLGSTFSGNETWTSIEGSDNVDFDDMCIFENNQ